MSQILDPLSFWCETHIRRMNRKFIVPADSWRPHTARLALDFMEGNAMKIAPHPSDSPDLANRTFFFPTTLSIS
jgi:hypothetical protein